MYICVYKTSRDEIFRVSDIEATPIGTVLWQFHARVLCLIVFILIWSVGCGMQVNFLIKFLIQALVPGTLFSIHVSQIIWQCVGPSLASCKVYQWQWYHNGHELQCLKFSDFQSYIKEFSWVMTSIHHLWFCLSFCNTFSKFHYLSLTLSPVTIFGHTVLHSVVFVQASCFLDHFINWVNFIIIFVLIFLSFSPVMFACGGCHFENFDWWQLSVTSKYSHLLCRSLKFCSSDHWVAQVRKFLLSSDCVVLAPILIFEQKKWESIAAKYPYKIYVLCGLYTFFECLFWQIYRQG